MNLRILIVVMVVIVNRIINPINARLIEDIKRFCKDRPKKNFCSYETIKIANDFQKEYEKIIFDKIQYMKNLHDKDLQKEIQTKMLKQKEFKIKLKIIEDYYNYFRQRNL
jgi:hypothetical protein